MVERGVLRWGLTVVSVLGPAVLAGESMTRRTRTVPELSPANASEWRFVQGDWVLDDGTLCQRNPDRLACALLTVPAVRLPVPGRAPRGPSSRCRCGLCRRQRDTQLPVGAFRHTQP
jgi:hypothetical protein